ncbi:M23 family metallopeptidase [Marinobacter sp. HL-58]|uniref:M23 family metallopeptidase n=1 Tax=Marinobacter sp. HL-58 TaxID=1479237 RepID=UPI000689F877|nr:M23 family metallopeptidase [Marinobacter sp. HL-58]KPP98022.1 MAG: Peptidase, M23/M37 family [Marinobacter sp. HL-58]
MTLLLLVLSHLFVPLVFIVAVGFGKSPSRVHWLSYLALAVVYLLLIQQAGAWIWLGGYWPWLFWAALAGSVVWFLVRRMPLLPPRPAWRAGTILSLGFNLAVLAALSVPAWSVLGARDVDARPVALQWPLAEGQYRVGQGGNSHVMNHHYGIDAQHHAIDVVRVGRFGLRTHGVVPSALEDYQIWNSPVTAPCSGEVTNVETGFPDQTPPRSDRDNPAGNFVAIYCADATVVLAHLQDGSVSLEPGDRVQSGDLLGRVGNSGNTSEPHLHMHAVEGRVSQHDELMWEANGLPMSFDGRYLVRNDVIRQRGT